MYIAFIIIGAISLIIGLLFLFVPGFMIELNEQTKKVVTTDNYAIKNHRLIGIIFLITAVILLYFRITM